MGLQTEIMNTYNEIKQRANEIEDDTERAKFLFKELNQFSRTDLMIIASSI